MTDYASLIERLEKADGPDRNLDGAIYWHLLEENRAERELWWVELQFSATPENVDWRKPFTSSLDAALSLVERKLPGWVWGVTSPDNPEDDPALQRQHFTARLRKSVVIIRAHAPTPALAVCLALLRALSEQRA